MTPLVTYIILLQFFKYVKLDIVPYDKTFIILKPKHLNKLNTIMPNNKISN